MVAQGTAAPIAEVIAARLTVGVVFDLRQAAAQPGASPQMAIQRVEGVRLKTADFRVAEHRPDDALDVAFMIHPGGRRQVRDIQVPVEQEANCGGVVRGPLGLGGPEQPRKLGGASCSVLTVRL
jgi:hypothetical protein